MAKQEHLEWLKEGVASWNDKRLEVTFTPDLSDTNLRGSNLQEVNLTGANLQSTDLSDSYLKSASLRRAYLIEAELARSDLNQTDLREANLSSAHLRLAHLDNAKLENANFTKANLNRASLVDADLRNAQLRNTLLRAADLSGAVLTGANLEGADVSSMIPHTSVTETKRSKIFTDLRFTAGLEQEQLEVMNGDIGTILPTGLKPPRHWPKIELPESHPNYALFEDWQKSRKTTDSKLEVTNFPTRNIAPDEALLQHTKIILHTLPASSASGRDAALRLRQVASLFHNQTGQNQSIEGELTELMADGFDALSDILRVLEIDEIDNESLISVLRARLQEQDKLIVALKKQLENKDSARKQIFVGALGAAGGTALISATAHLFGPDSASLINELWKLMSQGGTIDVPPPPVPTTLPPTTSI